MKKIKYIYNWFINPQTPSEGLNTRLLINSPADEIDNNEVKILITPIQKKEDVQEVESNNNSLHEMEDKEAKSEIKNQDERHYIDHQCERLESIINNLNSLNINGTYTKRKTYFSLFNLGLIGIPSYFVKRMIDISLDKSRILDQLVYNFSHLIFNNSTCAESTQENIYDCGDNNDSDITPHRSGFIVQTVLDQVNFMTQNVTETCQNMQDEYCQISTQKSYFIIAGVVLGTASLAMLATSAYYFKLRSNQKETPSCLKRFNYQAALPDDIKFLESCGISISANNSVEKVISKIRDKMVDLRMKTTNTDPNIYTNIVDGYLSTEPSSRDVAAHAFISRTFK